VFEIPFIEAATRDFSEAELSGYVATRLKRLAKVADKLNKAGWSVWLTVAGLAFRPSDPDRFWDGDDIDEELVADVLEALGITEDFSWGPSYTVDRLGNWVWEQHQWSPNGE
jgi:hypothetical protein